MSHHKKKHSHPIPSANQPQAGPPVEAEAGEQKGGGGAPLNEQDAKRRLGGFEGAGEHPLQQPSQINDGRQHSR